MRSIAFRPEFSLAVF